MERRELKISRLNIAYLEDGPSKAEPVLLLHGFPDDATGWTEVIAALARRGRRVLAPFVRGCGGTRFLHAETPRAGDFASLGQDALDFVEALGLNNLTVVGQDWGSPTAEIVAAERPHLVQKLVKLNWYGVYTMAEMARSQSFYYPQLRTLWYVWLLQTQLGEMVLQYDRRGLAKALWEDWSPTWDSAVREKALAAVVQSFEGEDWARVVLSAYRAGTPDGEVDPAEDSLRAKLKNPAPISCETVILPGADDGVERMPLDDSTRKRHFPRSTVERLPGVGHFPQREAPDAVVRAIMGAAL